MQLTDVHFADASHSIVNYTADGQAASAPVAAFDERFGVFSVTIAPYAAPTPTADDVRAEAQRRIVALVGAASVSACMIKQLNAIMRATELTLKGSANWTPAEATEAAALQAMAGAIKAIRAASNVLEPAPPADFTANTYWP